MISSETPTDNPGRNILLLSNSRNEGSEFLSHADDWVGELLSGVRSLLVIAYACPPASRAPQKARDYFIKRGISIELANDGTSVVQEVRDAEAVFVLGGNTFRLLAHLYSKALLEPLRDAALAGIPYLGASAGSNVACPTISTTNDMPIAEPPSLKSLGLFPAQINTHYVEDEYVDSYTGESRRQRIEEYVGETRLPVLGLPEGLAVRMVGGVSTLLGPRPAVMFNVDRTTSEIMPGRIDPEMLLQSA
jgi:dipeptidase E